MVGVKTVNLDGEEIYIFNSAIYILETSSGFSLELDIIVSEVALKKYSSRESIIAEIELSDSRVISSFMYIKSIPGRLPQLNLNCVIDGPYEYQGFDHIDENGINFPDVEKGISLADIRKVEMPDEKITLKLTLPIDQVEWLRGKTSKELKQIFKAIIYDQMN
ncbi:MULTISPECIES: hypothetical protein [unclassified Bacillus (in: firmicutes)]|uniref:hypothetical protein n=1 Tax=unclassified Bacillus (in: firmicutes) TaxID=185979 RepID=UPI00080ADFB1|nr:MULTISPECIES: hypothetical protein [unclassified Bacillus (in: firmicutes)]OCA86933.1 hypothetical protein A8L44_06650 [Bacillus sp. FJAT-27986]